jgi:hypothetical protein
MQIFEDFYRYIYPFLFFMQNNVFVEKKVENPTKIPIIILR